MVFLLFFMMGFVRFREAGRGVFSFGIVGGGGGGRVEFLSGLWVEVYPVPLFKEEVFPRFFNVM